MDCDLYKMLPVTLQEAVEDYPHLLDYLHMVPISQVGMPQYCPQLSRKLADAREPNFIYPVGRGIFTHILVDYKESRHHYITVEPTLTMDMDALVKEVEENCIQFADQLPEFDSDGDREKQLMAYIDQMTTLGIRTEPESNGNGNGKKGGLLSKISLRKEGDQLTKTTVTQRELDALKYLFARDKIGLGLLEPLLSDHHIEDIGCSGLGQVFIEHKIFMGLKSTITFLDLDELDQFVLRLAEQIKKPVTYKNPIADATLPSGSRINIVYGRDVSKRGSNFTIRRFSDVPISIFELVDFGTITYQMLAYLSLLLANGMNVFVSGESASGKTTMLNALTTFLHPTAKIITIEDTPELQVPQENWIREVVQSTKADDTSGAVTTFDLLKAALRQRPNEILVGEIRGPEGNVAFQAMQTGHSVMTTFHAATVEKLIQRITSKPIQVPKAYIDNLNAVVLMSTVKLPNGKSGRRVTGISEIVGYDPTEEAFNIIESFQWDAEVDKYDFSGYMTSFILEHKIAPRIGIPGHKKQRIYAEVERRARILEKLHKEQGVTGFYEVLEVLGKAQREGLF